MTAGRTVNSGSVHWGTPHKFIEPILGTLGEIHLDPCSNEYSIIDAKTKILLPDDGLKVNWHNYKTIYINPPYGRDSERKTSIRDWIKKAHNLFNDYADNEILMLIPVATNTKHWKEYIFGSATICFLEDTRFKFLENGIPSNKGAPMACAMIYYGYDDSRFKAEFRYYGYITN